MPRVVGPALPGAHCDRCHPVVRQPDVLDLGRCNGRRGRRVRRAHGASAGSATLTERNTAAISIHPVAPKVPSVEVKTAGASIWTVAVVASVTPWYAPRASSRIRAIDRPQVDATYPSSPAR